MTRYYVITMPSTPVRQENATKEFERENVPVDWVYGIDAVAHGIRPSLYMHSNPDGSKYYISAGACALVLSHYMAWRYAERDGEEDFVVFEDDVLLGENFLEKLEAVKREAKRVGSLAVWLEYCCIDPSRMDRAGDGLRYALPMCTAAVWYQREALPILFKAIEPAHAPVDILLQQRACAQLKATVTDPQLCFQVKYNDTVNSTIHREMPTEPPGEIQ